MNYRRLSCPRSVRLQIASVSARLRLYDAANSVRKYVLTNPYRNELSQRRSRISGLYCLVIGTILATPAASSEPTPPTRKKTAFDLYVETPDKAFSWKLVQEHETPEAITYVVDMTSQRWRTGNEVNRPIWQHWLTIVRPKNVRSQTAMLFIGGGRNGNQPPGQAPESILQLALASQTIVCELGTIPNQPLIFHNDGVERSEDDLIGYAWNQYLKTEDPHWLPRLPMVKAVVRAMDTVQAFLKSRKTKPLSIDQFVIAGGSKRGWTTWMTAAADRRVTAILPIVIDVLNVKISMDHHYAAYGFWAPAIGDYVHHKVTHRRNSPRYAKLLQLVDPYAYRTRFKMPKCIINATGDEFFLPDSSQFYFDDLPGEKHLCYVPNSNHSLGGTDALDTILAYYFSIAHDIPRPRFTWKYEAPGSLSVDTETKPTHVRLWQAHNPKTRDFRVQTIGRAYRSQELVSRSEQHYQIEIAAPKEGWTAFFVQLEFDVGAPTPLRLTTPAYVIPDKLPFSAKQAPELPE